MSFKKSILSVGIVVTLLMQISFVGISATALVIYEDFTYDEQDLALCEDALRADTAKGFSDGFKKNPYGDSLEMGNFKIEGNTLTAMKKNPSRLFRKFNNAVDMNPSQSTVYYASWKQYLGEGDALTGSDDLSKINQGQVVDFSANNLLRGGGFIRSSDGKTRPFVNWAINTNSGVGNVGNREMRQGTWYNMFLKIESSPSTSSDRFSLKAYPDGEYPHVDWDASIHFSTSEALRWIGFTTITLNDNSTQKFSDFKLEQYDRATANQAEEAVMYAYASIGTHGWENKRVKAVEKVSKLGEGALKYLLLSEIEGMSHYLETIEKIITFKNWSDSTNYTAATNAVSALPDSLRKSDFMAEINKLSALYEGAYNDMRAKRLYTLVGGNHDKHDSQVKSKISSLTQSGTNLWNSMIKGEGRVRLWNEHNFGVNASGIDLQTTFQNLKAMAVAYRLDGSTLYENTELRDDIVDALIFLHDNVYNAGVHYQDNGTLGWYYWEIGVPLNLLDCLILMYEHLPYQLVEGYVKAINHFSPSILKINFGRSDSTGANLLWRCSVAILSATLTADENAMLQATNAMQQAFLYADEHDLEDGFYTDGSYIQHKAVSYNGAYGASAFEQVVDLTLFLETTPYELTFPEKDNVYDWAFNALAPFIYKGAMMDMTKGRTIVRESTSDRSTARGILRNFLKLSLIANEQHSTRLQNIIRQNMLLDESETANYITGLPIYLIKQAKEILNTNDTEEISEEVKIFPFMDKAIYRNQNFAFGISMFSERQYSYEHTTVSGENKKGFYTGFGATYLYNQDLKHYSNNYWPTVDPYSLAGITATDTLLSDAFGANKYGKNSWAGGVVLEGKYGAVGMELLDYENSDGITPMTAKKSWFMLDNQIVAVGADIKGTIPGITVKTVAENRIMSKNDLITVDGSKVDFGSDQVFDSPHYMHLEGDKDEIGYAFLKEGTVRLTALERNGKWSDISDGGSNTLLKNPYFTVSIEHGLKPTNGEYAYAILPGRSASDVLRYSQSPDIVIEENSSVATAVRHQGLKVIAVNFWSDTLHTVSGITSNKAASVMVKENNGELLLAVSNPTQKEEVIELEIDKTVFGVEHLDERISVIQTSPTLKLSINTAALKGRGVYASFTTHPNSYDPTISTDTSVTELPDTVLVKHNVNYYGEDARNPIIIMTVYSHDQLLDIAHFDNISVSRANPGHIEKVIERVGAMEQIKVFTFDETIHLNPLAPAFSYACREIGGEKVD